MKQIRIKLVEGGKAPVYKTAGAACCDAYARLDEDEVIYVGERKVIPLGFAIELPEGYEAVIRPRSGLSKSGIDEVIGTIDCDFRNEIGGLVINNTPEPITIHNGDRVCQIKIQKAEQFSFVVVSELSETVRGMSGWGSTGV